MPTMNRQEFIVQLLHDFNYYRSFCKSIVEARETKPINDFAAKPDKLDLLDELITWCQDQDVAPRFWLYHLFAVRRWRYPPKFERGHLLSTRMLKSYAYRKATPFFSERLEATERLRKELENLNHDPNLRLTPGIETLKQVYARQRSWTRCMDDMRQTYGFHPLSEYCQKCPESKRCEDKVKDLFPFDIMAARRGELKMNSRLAQETVWRAPNAGSPTE